jgi:hypothetical protein
MHLGGPLPSGRVTPYRAAQLAARRSRPARKAGVSAHSGDGRCRGACGSSSASAWPVLLSGVRPCGSTCAENDGRHCSHRYRLQIWEGLKPLRLALSARTGCDKSKSFVHVLAKTCHRQRQLSALTITPSTENHPATRLGKPATPPPRDPAPRARENGDPPPPVRATSSCRKYTTSSRTASVSVTENDAAKSECHD